MPKSVLSSSDLALDLEGSECEFCSDGELVRATYKGNAAIVCNTCESPTAQFW